MIGALVQEDLVALSRGRACGVRFIHRHTGHTTPGGGTVGFGHAFVSLATEGSGL